MEILDHYYSIIDDFINPRSNRSDEVNHVRSPDSIHFHFNKPGFDLAVIITDKCLIPTIVDFQVPFQSKHGLTTHVIYLPDFSRLKFCIRDLKLHEILYAIIVNANSEVEDEYYVFILNDSIKYQRRMRYDEAVDLIKSDYLNYTAQLKEMLNTPERWPHPRNKTNDAFIEPTKEIRHLLCLLFDHRMLEYDELMQLSNFVKMRKMALTKMGNRTINYDLNDRPMPYYRQEKFKYYLYECKPDKTLNVKEYFMDNGGKCKPSEPANIPSNDVEMDSANINKPHMSRPLVCQPLVSATHVLPKRCLAQPIPRTKPAVTIISSSNSQPITSSHVPIANVISPSQPTLSSQVQRSLPPFVQPLMSIITSNPYTNTVTSPNKPSNAESHFLPSTPATFGQPHANMPIVLLSPPFILPNQSQMNGVSAQPHTSIGRQSMHVGEVQSHYTPHPSMPQSYPPEYTMSHYGSGAPITQPYTTTIVPQYHPVAPSPAIVPQVQAANISPQFQPVIGSPVTQRHIPVLLTQPTNISPHRQSPSLATDNNAQSPIKPIVAQSPPNFVCTLSTEDTPDNLACLPTSSNHNTSSDSVTLTYQLSPISNDSTGTHSHEKTKIEIDLTKDVYGHSVAAGLFKPTSAAKATNSRPEQPVSYIIHLTDDNPTVQPKCAQISLDGLVSILKFVVSVSPFSLAPDNVVVESFKRSISQMEDYMISCGASPVTVDLRACCTGGCAEIIRIIGLLYNDTVSSKHNLKDLTFAWTYFPRGVSEDSITTLFYKLMKMLEVTKLVPASNDILLSLVKNLQRVVYFNFQLSESQTHSYNLINFFPTLFPEYFNLQDEFHNLNIALPPPEPLNMAVNSELDKSILESKVKFVVGPLMEFFIGQINSITYQLDSATMEVIHGAMRTLRFCLRKICIRLLPEHLKEGNLSVTPEKGVDRTFEILDEINYVLREVNIMKSVLFTKKHYEFINLILDFSIKIEKCVADNSDPDLELPEQEYLIHIEPTQFIQEFSTNIKTAVLPYHPDTEIDSLKRALCNRWTDTLHQAFKGVCTAPDGSRISKEMKYLLPKCWSKPTFEDAVLEASLLSYRDWEKMLTNDFSRARLTYTDVRNNYLIWLSNHHLDHRRAMESMTSYQKLLDAKILQLSM